MQMNGALALAGCEAAGQRACFAGLIARRGVAVRHLVAGLPQHLGKVCAFAAIGCVRRYDAVIAAAQDMRFRQGLQKRSQLEQTFGLHTPPAHTANLGT